MTDGRAGVLPDRTAVLQRRVRRLVGGVLVYNTVEALVALTAGAIASSTALIGFGLDSIVEVTSALAITWQYAHHTPADREHRALRVIAGSFFALAAYVSVDAVTALAGVREAEHSSLGIALTALSLLIMPAVSYAERRTGRELGSASVIADSKQTLLCSYLSAVVLGGLVLNSTLGWSWADPVAGLAIAALAVREGRGALRGDVCCAPPSMPIAADEPDGCCPSSTLDRTPHPPVPATTRRPRAIGPSTTGDRRTPVEIVAKTDAGAGPVPIVCTLTSGQVADRLQDWADLLGQQRGSPSCSTADTAASVTVTFPPNPAIAAAAAELAAAEQACCAFITFDLRIDPSGTTVTATAPADALPVLETLLHARFDR